MFRITASLSGCRRSSSKKSKRRECYEQERCSSALGDRLNRSDLGSRESILKLAEHAQNFGNVKNLINAAGVSPSQASVADILRVDLYGTAVLLEEFGKIIGEGGSGVVISSQSGHRLGALSEDQNEQLATSPTEELLSLPFITEITDTLKAYQYSKRCNVLRVEPGLLTRSEIWLSS